MPVNCQYCGQPAELSTGAREFPELPEVAGKRFWVCRPCDARVGCHGTTDVPLGELGDGKLRAARQAGHRAFDPLWREMWRINGGLEIEARGVAYTWLAEELGIPREQCHFGGMPYEQILKATLICQEMQEELDKDRSTGDLL